MAFQSMAISDTSSLKARHRAARAAFRRDIAEQLHTLGGDVTGNGEHLAVELPGGEGLRVVVGFNEDTAGREGWSEWLQLRIETPDWAEARLTLGWTQADDDASRLALYEKLTDVSLPPGKRGLNTEANAREGDYARADAVRALRDELAGAGRGRVLSLAVVPVPALRVPAVTGQQAQTERQPVVLDAEFVPAGESAGGTPGRTPSPAELRELLIAEIFAAMQHELLSKEAGLKGTGALPAAKAHFIEAGEWAMLGVAYAVDAVTSRTAIASFIPGTASWIYGLVGPVLIGGLSSLAKSKIDKGVALGLMASWALAVGWVTASDKEYLDAAQAWFPKSEDVAAQREALSIARLDRDAAEKEGAQLEGKPAGSVTAAIAEARRRWQAQELEKSAKAEKAEAAAKLEAAKAKSKAARDRVVREEGKLERALLGDGSRKEAWYALFAIFTVINFVGPYGIGRVIEKWRRDHGAAKASAQESHYARAGAKILRENRPAQKARAMQLFGPAVEKLMERGVTAELLNAVDGADVSAAAAERLDRSVNPQKFRPRLRLWGASQS